MLPLPYRDENPSDHFPVVTVLIIVANVIVFFWMCLLNDPASFVERWGFRASDPIPIPIPITILTSLFLHAGLLHLVANMWYLWLFGDNVEDRLGWLYPVFYVAAGACAAWAHWWLVSPLQRHLPVIGASGAIRNADAASAATPSVSITA